MTDAQFLAWLKDPMARRVLLVEAQALVGGVLTPIYLSTRTFTTGPADTPANTVYLPIVATSIKYTETLATTPGGEASISTGALELDNPDGIRDHWNGFVWVNQRITAWVGDARWPRTDFRQVFDGVQSKFQPKSRTMLSLEMRDKSQRLNTPLTETKLGGTTANKDKLRPVTLGEGHNVSPLLVDPVLLDFQVNDGATENIDEVRANGMVVSPTINNAAGTFRLTLDAASAVITVSLQGDNVGGYRNTLAPLIRRLVTGYGKVSERLTEADIDTANFSAFEAAHPQPLGYYAAERVNVLNACQALTSSLGAQMSFSRLGKLRLLKVALPPAGTPIEVGPAQMLLNTLTPVGTSDVVAAIKLGFNQNWTVQDNLQSTSALPAEHIALYAEEWLTTTMVDETVKATYKLDAEPVQADTALLRRVDAEPEASRRLALWSKPHTTYEFDGLPETLMYELGQTIRVTHPRYGMQGGVLAQIVSLTPDWENCCTKVRFIV